MNAPVDTQRPTRPCVHKRRYSRAAAIRAASRLSVRAYGGKLTAYSCDRCGGWHVGHRQADRTTAWAGRALADITARTA